MQDLGVEEKDKGEIEQVSVPKPCVVDLHFNGLIYKGRDFKAKFEGKMQ